VPKQVKRVSGYYLRDDGQLTSFEMPAGSPEEDEFAEATGVHLIADRQIGSLQESSFSATRPSWMTPHFSLSRRLPTKVATFDYPSKRAEWSRRSPGAASAKSATCAEASKQSARCHSFGLLPAQAVRHWDDRVSEPSIRPDVDDLHLLPADSVAALPLGNIRLIVPADSLRRRPRSARAASSAPLRNLDRFNVSEPLD
jgi:hypothetical protein